MIQLEHAIIVIMDISSPQVLATVRNVCHIAALVLNSLLVQHVFQDISISKDLLMFVNPV